MVRKNISPISNINIRNESIEVFKKPISRIQIQELTHNQYSTSSVLAMTSDWNRFLLFCHSKHVQPLPASITTLRIFLEKESEKRKFSSIRRYNITIGIIHFLHGCPDPTSHRQIKFTLSALKHYKFGDARQAKALTINHIKSLEKRLLSERTIRSYRDLAIYYVMFECALKRSDLKNILLEDIFTTGEKYSVYIKENQYQLSPSASYALSEWMRHLKGSQGGYLFRRIDKHSNIGTLPLDDSSIYRILRRASDLLGLAQEHRFTGQSARVGSARELESQGYKIKEIQDFGRWLSPAMPAQYLNRTSKAQEEMAKFKVIKPWD